MSSKPLRELTALVVDSAAMNGPITRRDVAEEIVRRCPKDHFDPGEEAEWIIQGVMNNYVTAHMNKPLSEHMTEKVLRSLPPDLREVVDGMPSYICITPSGGRKSQHVMTVLATVEQVRANVELKTAVSEHAESSLADARDWLNLMIRYNAKTLGEAIERAAKAAA